MLQQGEEIYNLVKSLAAKYGFADFGCARAEEVSPQVLSAYLHAQKEGHFASMHYLNNNMEKRFNPQLLVEGARSILVFLAPYSLPDSSTAPKGIAQYALGKDYHQVIKGRLFAIMELLKERYPHFQGRAFTDSAPVMEREWGERAGIGFIGKNNFLISKKCGIKNFIAAIICNLEIAPTDQMEPGKREATAGQCGECRRCLDSCPTKALKSEYSMDCRLCISYHTIENRNLAHDAAQGTLPPFGEQYFGCDSCLDACPWNSRNLPGWEEFHTKAALLEEASPQWWEGLSKEEFKELFKDSPLFRGGLENIQTALAWGKKGEKNG